MSPRLDHPLDAVEIAAAHGRALRFWLSSIVASTRWVIRSTIPASRRVASPSRSSVSAAGVGGTASRRSEEHTSELQSLMRISYAVFCLKKKKKQICKRTIHHTKRNKHTYATQLYHDITTT